MMNRNSISQRLRRLPAGDRLLIKALVSGALVTLVLGVVLGLATALIRTNYLGGEPQTGYRLMAGHGVTIFFYWLYFAQMALLMALSATQAGSGSRIAVAPAAWGGLLLMLLGFATNQVGTWTGPPLLYDGSPDLVGDDRLQAAPFYLGYVALACGLFLLAASAVGTAIVAKRRAHQKTWSTVGFAVVAWAGLVMVSSLASLNTFLPAALWTLGLVQEPANYSTGWHLLFHNLHYLPLMATVIIWYAMIQDLTGVGSIFGQRFSKGIFTLYLVLVPPTSLYHMFLEPDLSPILRGLGSLLSLFISVPTVAAFLVIVSSLEANARQRGARGLFSWIRMLPWHEPAMAAISMAAVNLALGGILAFVLIQERLAPLLSDTFFVPATFHFLTIGTVTLTVLAAFTWSMPTLYRKPLWAPRLLGVLPYTLTVGLVMFGAAGMAAGLNGMPRRVLDVSYEGNAPALWTAMSPVIAAGAVIMALSLLLYVALLVGTTLGAGGRRPLAASPPVLVIDVAAAMHHKAWTASLSILVLVAGMYAATALAFALLNALPLAGAVP
jgi:cytochrome c oxidase subunit 1